MNPVRLDVPISRTALLHLLTLLQHALVPRILSQRALKARKERKT